MKLSDYAKKVGVTYRTAWNWFKSGKLDAIQMPGGTIIVKDEINKKQEYIIIYARVSSSENKNNLDSQAERLTQYSIARGYKINEIVKEIGSGVNDNRQKLKKILSDGKATKIVVEHKDRLTRFGFNYLTTLLEKQGCHIEIVNEAGNDKDDLMQDLISIITSMCARYYGLRRSKRKTDKIIQELRTDDQET